MSATTAGTRRSLTGLGIVAAVLWAATSVGADAWTNVPDTEGDPASLSQALTDHQLAAWIMVLGSIYVAVAVIFFAAGLHRVLALESFSGFAAATLGGGVFLAAGMLIHQGISKFALLAAANHHDTGSLHTLGYLDAVTWLPMSAGAGAFLLAVGLGARRSRLLPGWLAIATTIFGVLALLGPGFLVFWLLAPIWFVVTGIAVDRGTPNHQEPATAPARLTPGDTAVI